MTLSEIIMVIGIIAVPIAAVYVLVYSHNVDKEIKRFYAPTKYLPTPEYVYYIPEYNKILIVNRLHRLGYENAYKRSNIELVYLGEL